MNRDKPFESWRRKAIVSCSAAALSLAMLAAAARGGDAWPQFRGPGGQGHADDAELPLTWSEAEGVAWKTPIVGRGWSSPVVANGRIWLTTAEERPATDAQREKSIQAAGAIGPVNAMAVAASVRLSAVEVDLATGNVLRQIKLFDVESPPPIHGLNSFASPTPALAGGLVLCHFGAMGTACIDEASGDVLWRRKLEINHIVGPGSSPIIYHGLAIITCDGGDKQYIAALDLKTGEPRWRVDRPPMRNDNPDLRKAYSTPLVYSFGGRDQMVIPGAQWFISYDPATGDELWRVDHGSGFSNVPAPIFENGTTYLDTGFGKAQLWAVRVDGSGDVTDTHVLWRHLQQMPTMPSPVISGGRVFVISDGGVASCLGAETGEVLWRERVPGQYSASPLLGAGRVYFCSHEGRTTVIAASDKFEKLAENQLDGKLMASPAAVEGDLILRTDTHLYRISR
jgi:outer membrane protein assembly factor BamB